MTPRSSVTVALPSLEPTCLNLRLPCTGTMATAAPDTGSCVMRLITFTFTVPLRCASVAHAAHPSQVPWSAHSYRVLIINRKACVFSDS